MRTMSITMIIVGVSLTLGTVCVAAPMSQEHADSAGAMAMQGHQDSVFYVTKTGDKYHRDGCDRLEEGKIAMTLEAIAQSAYMPCRLCRADSDRRYPAPDDTVDVDRAPSVLRHKTPVYPEKAEFTGTEGRVWVQALVNWEGEVVDARIAKASGTDVGFEEAALKAAYECRYKPALKDGRPVAVWVTYPVTFKLKK
jgi:TonB family protein